MTDHASGAVLGAAAEPLLAGALAGFALADVLQLLELGARSGVLAVDGGPNGSGRVVVRRGRVVSAEAACGGASAGILDAVASLLELPSGRWTFHASDVLMPPADGSGAPVSIGAILVDAARRRDERARAGAAFGPGGDAAPRRAFGHADGADATGCLTALHLRVLAAVDGKRDVPALAAALRCEVARVGDAVAALIALGLVSSDRAVCLT